MRIAILTSSYPRYPGDGTAPFIKSFAENYAKLGHLVYVIVPYDPAVNGDNDLENVQVIRYRYIWPNSLSLMGHAQSLKGDARLSALSFLLLPFFLFFGIIALYRVCREKKIDVIHANWVLPNGPIALVVSRLLKIPYVLSLHGSDIYVSQKNPAFSRVSRSVFDGASSVTACSRELKEAAVRLGSNEEKTYLLAWGADPEKFSPSNYSIDLRNKFGIAESEILVIAVGRLVYKKGFNILISAWKKVYEQFPTSRLIIGGGGPLQEALEQKAKELHIDGSIFFSGRINWQEMPTYLASADIFVLPSVKDEHGNMDGLPTVLLEAMSSGTACIASEIGGVPLVIEDGKNGILVQEKSSDQLSDSLINVIKNDPLRQELKDSARNSILLEHNWLNVARKLVGLFSSAIEKNKSTRRPKRLGVLYRKKYIELYLKKKPPLNTRNVLDVGCFDGDSVSFLGIQNHIAVDLDPEPIHSNIHYVKADGCNLPFSKGSFDTVFALDVIEHIQNDRQFTGQLKDALAPGGRLILTTPSEKIRLYPWFLTKWISHKWGHDLRMGYTRDQLVEYFSGEGFAVQIQPWSAKQYRIWYLFARFLLQIFPTRIMKWVENMAEKDSQNQDSENGFWIVEATREN
ncbi:glycosyltransferase [Longilinea arvoryzae]|uniref:Glycosyltransferase n=1 Tax=Longilinea arvoryzae TaxID=360412 RepID=A0A0S7BFH4_9CHLR|nr:glycosyltransferase [Longilinea arvoryzae]GAP13760.1 glycosyltransferase [Longilinea arvoryzae]